MKGVIALVFLAALTCLCSAQPRLEPKRLTQNELTQLADILFRLPERNNVDTLRLHYVIAPVNGMESIEVVLEPVSSEYEEEETKKEELEIYRFTRDKCMTFFEDNFGRVLYDNSGKPRTAAIYIGGLPESAVYDEILLHFKSTPVFTFRRKNVSRTCARLNLLDDPVLNDFRRQQREAEKAEKAEEARSVKPRFYRLTRKQTLQLADCITRLGFPVDYSGDHSLRLQYLINRGPDVATFGELPEEELFVVVHSKRLKSGEYLDFYLKRSGKCLRLQLTFSADVLQYQSGPFKGKTEVEDPTSGGNGVTEPTEEYLMKEMFPSPLYIVPAKEIRKTCAELTSIDRRFPLELNRDEAKQGGKK